MEKEKCMDSNKFEQNIQSPEKLRFVSKNMPKIDQQTNEVLEMNAKSKINVNFGHKSC